MYLLIDVGNTRIKYGCYADGKWIKRDITSGATPSLHLPADFEPRRVIIANVAGESAIASLTQQLSAWDSRTHWLHATATQCGVVNRYEQPETLGPDRWACAIGAWQQLQRPCLIVSAGTATTIDLLQEGGIFGGGCILPGVDMMKASLAGGTANLPNAKGGFDWFPRNTHDAIVSGCLHAQLGAIERMSRLLPVDSPIVITGGAAEQLIPHLGGNVLHHPWLVLEGLLSIAALEYEPD